MHEEKRSNQANKLMWALLADISRQLEWCIDGKMQKCSKEDYKEILSAGLRREQRIAQGIDGGFVLLGQRTSKMTVKQMSELIEFIYWFCCEKNIKISAPKQYEEWHEQYGGKHEHQ